MGILVVFITVVIMFVILKTYSLKFRNNKLKVSKSVLELVDGLVHEIHDCLNLGKTHMIHKVYPDEPPIDGEVVALVTFKVATITPCILTFHHGLNEVAIELHKLETNHE